LLIGPFIMANALAALPVRPSWDVACLGPYKVLGTIAEGGMGIVLRGQDVRTGAMVAIKTVRSQRKCDETCLRREISVLGRLSHPGIVPVIDNGTSGGAPWMAMELLEGETVDDLITALWPKRVPYPAAAAAGNLPEVVGIVAQLCRALEYLHARGLVHRDVKPANVFVGDDGQVTLLDFGLVCAAHGAANDVNAADLCVGTMEYAAPEQIRGEPVDARADIYSVGCVLYELISGRRLADADDAIGWGPLAPSDLVARVPPRLETLLLSMLAERRDERPSSIGRIADALEEIAWRPAEAA